MATTASRYGQVGAHFANALINYTGDTIRAALVSSLYTPNLDTHDFFDDITNELSTANGYTAGGAALGTKSLSYISADDQTALLAADTSWTPGPAETLTARYCVVYKSTGTPATSPLMALIDFGADISSTGGTFLIDWNDTGGVMKL